MIFHRYTLFARSTGVYGCHPTWAPAFSRFSVECYFTFELCGFCIFGYPCRSSGPCALTTVEILVNPFGLVEDLRLAGSLLMIYFSYCPTYKVS